MIRKMFFFAIALMLPMAVYAAGYSSSESQGMPVSGALKFSDLDTNHDGYISRQEVQADQQRLQALADNWSEADQNADGQVSASEFSAFEEKTVPQEMRQDQNINREDLEDNNPDP
jgi:Ca2+-binding EF-hand superfamily protein